jgi:RNA polymerase sigma-70 factor (ECF subfamily)
MARTAGGEEAAFRLLVLRWEKDVLAFLIHMLGSVEEAEDLVQDTFVQVYGQASAYRAQGRFQSWLFRIAGNLARSRLRRRKILRWVRLDTTAYEVPSEARGPLEDLERQEAVRSVRAAVAQLPARQRQALVLHRFQGLKYKDVALAMETTVPGVESLIQRALGALKTQLTGEGE